MGTNFGVKSHSCPMLPITYMDTSVKNVNIQAAIKAAELDAFCYSEYTNNDKNWSTRPTALFIVFFGEGLVSSKCQQLKTKHTRRVG